MFGSFPIPLDSKKKYRVRTQTFTADTTWIKPPKIWGDVCWVSGCGSGGAGGGSSSSFPMGGGGGSGCWKLSVPYDVSGVSSVTVVIGPAASGVNQGNGNDGTASSFGTLTFPGGKGGLKTSGGGAGGQNGNSASPGSDSFSVKSSGSGGGTPWGPGGNALGTDTYANNGGANTGAGGGGGYYSGSGFSTTGGSSGSGIVEIWWIEEY